MSKTSQLPDDLTPLEYYSIAIRAEIEARDIYHRVAERIVNESLKEKVLFLEAEEEKHRSCLEAMYARTFPGVKLLLPENTFLPRIDVAMSDTAGVEEVFEIAMEWEKMSADFYEELSNKATDPGSVAVLISFSATEWSHYHLVKGEYEMVKAFPSYAGTKDFHPGEDFLHIGP